MLRRILISVAGVGIHIALVISSESPCCFTIPPERPKQSLKLSKKSSMYPWGWQLWTYYDFLVDFAAPLASLLHLRSSILSKKTTIYLPGWNLNYTSNDGLVSNEMFHLTNHYDPQRSMQAHSDFLFGPLGLDFANWDDQGTYQLLPCEVLPWRVEERQAPAAHASVYLGFREYVYKRAGIPSSALLGAPDLDAVFIRRGSQSNATCTGVCQRHLKDGFFRDAASFMDRRRSTKSAYRIVETDTMSLLEQVLLFSSARVIVGLHGAGLSNIMFARPGTFVIEMGRRVTSHYEVLAGKLGLRYINMEALKRTCGEFAEWQFAFTPCLERLLDEANGLTKKGKASWTKSSTQPSSFKPWNPIATAGEAQPGCEAEVESLRLRAERLKAAATEAAIRSAELAVGVQAAPPQPCFKVPPDALTSMSGALFEYYHFLIEFAAPMAYLFRNQGPGVQTLFLPSWDNHYGFQQQRHYFTYTKEPSRTTQAQFNVLFNSSSSPLHLNVLYWPEKASYAALRCTEVDWDPGSTTLDRMWSNDSPLVYQHFRRYAHALAGVVNGKRELPPPSAAAAKTSTPGSTSTSGGGGGGGDDDDDAVIDVLLIRRGEAPLNSDSPQTGRPSCIGSCRRHLDPGFFENATAFLECRLPGLRFRVVSLEALGLLDQVRLFARARVVVALHGAALSNVVFSRPGTFVIELRRNGRWICYEPLVARKMGQRYAHCPETSFSPCVQRMLDEATGFVSPLSESWLPRGPIQ